MIASLVKKEWKKTKTIISLFAVLSIIALAFIYFGMKNLVEYNEAHLALQEIISKSKINLTYIKNFLMIFGVILGFFQYYPEVVHARVRLHLHLPVKQNYLIHVFMVYGLGVILLFSCIVNGIFFASIVSMFPVELFYGFETKLFSAFLLSIIGYLGIAIFLITPSKNVKLGIFALSLALLMVYQDYTRGYFAGETLYYYFSFIFIAYYMLLFDSFKTYTRGYVK